MATENSFDIKTALNALNQRIGVAAKLREQLPHATERVRKIFLDSLSDRTRNIEFAVTEELSRPLLFAFEIAKWAVQGGDSRQDYLNFARDFAIYSSNSEDASKNFFLEEFSQYKNLDLKLFFEDHPEWELAIKPLQEELTAEELFLQNIDFSKSLQPLKGASDNVLSDGQKIIRSESVKKIEPKKEKDDSEGAGGYTFEQVCEKFEPVSDLFTAGDSAGYWKVVDGTRYLSRSKLVALFEQKRVSDNSDAILYQAVIGLIKGYSVSVDKEVDDLVTKLDNVGKSFYFKEDDVKKILMYAAAKTSKGERPNVKLREKGAYKTPSQSKKKVK